MALALALTLVSTGTLGAQDPSGDVAELRRMLTEMKTDYERRIDDLEQRLDRAERSAKSAASDADQAMEIAEQSAIDASRGSSAVNTFNPAMGVVLIGRLGDIGNSWEAIPGFIPGGELGPGGSGFSLGESEINMNANVDHLFYANLTLALEDEGGETAVAAEEAYVQTTSLPAGLNIKGGHYFSNVGYLNAFHAHADDFADRPLPYQAFFGGQYGANGIQMTWVAPTSLFLELGAELNWGSGFPMSGNGETSPDAWTLSAKIGGDVGFSHSWQVGLSYLDVDVVGRPGGEDAAAGETFTGDSNLAVFDFVWKWAPDGNATINNVKLQGEYFRRNEQGVFASLPYDGDQRGWYLQGAWQFVQNWRVGLRYDEVSSDNGALFAGTILEDPAWTPRRTSVMVDWSPSEFSRIRLQYTDDQVTDSGDNQLLLQYLMSLGAHGAHRF
jgi:hypothetical protein